jgi:dipeptidyl aminopeptidase/acylaminoacyl peptidase
MNARIRVTILLIFLSCTANASEEEIKVLSSTDIFELEFASDPRVSPDGSQVVYERRFNDIMSDKTVSNLWIVNTNASGHRPLVSGPIQASSPRWSDDGDRIAYVRSEESSSSIQVRWMDTGQTAQIASLLESPSSLSWSPDGRWLAFTMRVATKSEPLVKPPEKPEGAEWSEPVTVIDSVIYRWDGEGFLEPAYSHIFVVPTDGGTPRQLTAGEFNHEGPISWAPDSSKLLFAANRSEEWEYQRVERDIYTMSVDDGALSRLTDRLGGESQPTVSPDGQKIAYIYDDNRMLAYRNKVLHVMNTDGTGDHALTVDLDRSVDDIQWAANGRSIYFQYDDRAVRKIARVTLSGEIEDVIEGLGGTTIGRPYMSGSFTVSDNGIIAYTHGTAHRPADVAVAGRRGERVVTELNEDLLGNRILGEVHEIAYSSSFDGVQIQGWYVTPPGFDPEKQYPLILEIHGGPHSAYGANFSAEIQRYTAEGYVVVYDNHRGSTSYGEDFALLLQNKYASPEDFADHMSGVDAVIELGFVDPDNLFITGGSAGGIGSAYAIGLTDRFRAAAVAKPVINWISKTLTGDSYTYQITHQFPGMPWDELEHYWQRSPLSLVGNVATPTLLITGEEDYRTPISETEQFYQALKMRRVEAVMVRIPGSPHGIAGRPSRLIAKTDNILAWFARHKTE